MTDLITPDRAEAVQDGGLDKLPSESLEGDAPRAKRIADRWVTAGIAVSILVAWEIAALTYFAKRDVLSAPTSIVAQMWTDRVLLVTNGADTLKAALIGFVCGQAVAVMLATTSVLFGPLERVMSKLALVAYSLPTLALAPILGTIVSRSNTRVIVVALVVFFPTLLSMSSGLRAVSSDTVQMVRSLGGSRVTVLRKVRWRASLPSMFAGFKIGVPGAMFGAIASEWLGADHGLGIVMVNALGYLEPARVWGICVVCVLVTMAGYAVVGLVDRRVNRWAAEVRGGTR